MLLEGNNTGHNNIIIAGAPIHVCKLQLVDLLVNACYHTASLVPRLWV